MATTLDADFASDFVNKHNRNRKGMLSNTLSYTDSLTIEEGGIEHYC